MPSTNKNLPEGALTKDEFLRLKKGAVVYKTSSQYEINIKKATLAEDANAAFKKGIVNTTEFKRNIHIDMWFTGTFGYLFDNYWFARAYLLKVQHDKSESSRQVSST